MSHIITCLSVKYDIQAVGTDLGQRYDEVLDKEKEKNGWKCLAELKKRKTRKFKTREKERSRERERERERAEKRESNRK